MYCKSYTYAPLEGSRDIRLLVLQPGQLGSPIHCTLVVTSLDSAPEYETISYCWGDESIKQKIFCDDCTIDVTVSLYTALDRLRFSDRPRTLWADAVCIDQVHNSAEKGSQILLMTNIYSLAQRVLVWLGDDTAGLAGIETVISRGLELLPEETLDPEEMQKRIKGLPMYRESNITWDPFIRLVSKSWFQRKWVVQEVALSRNAVLICGPIQLRWNDVSSLALRIMSYDLSATLPDTDYDINTQPWQFYNISMILAATIYRPQITLLDAIKATKKFFCKDPRDHIYGLLGLIANKQGSVRDIVPAYDAPVEEVYRRLTEDLLIKDKNLGILSLAPSSGSPWRQSVLSLPSWVPDLTLQDFDSITGYTVREGKFSAGANRVPEISIQPRTSRLLCQGIIFDRIGKLSRCIIEEPEPELPSKVPGYLKEAREWKIRLVIRQQQYFKHCEELISDGGGIGSLSPERLSAFCKTMVCERLGLSNRSTEDISIPFMEYFHGVMGMMDENDIAALGAFSRCYKFSAMIEPTLTAMAFPRRLCITADDRVGQAPRRAKVGDLICILFGGEVPFVIRPTENGAYTLVGECYINGVMDGELVNPGQAESTQIILE